MHSKDRYPTIQQLQNITRRHFLRDCGFGIGAMALSSALWSCGSAGSKIDRMSVQINPMAPRAPHFPARVKSVIYMHMAGAPSQLELFDFKPELSKLNGKECPPSLLEGKRFAFIRGVPKMLGPQANFQSTRPKWGLDIQLSATPVNHCR